MGKQADLFVPVSFDEADTLSNKVCPEGRQLLSGSFRGHPKKSNTLVLHATSKDGHGIRQNFYLSGSKAKDNYRKLRELCLAIGFRWEALPVWRLFLLQFTNLDPFKFVGDVVWDFQRQTEDGFGKINRDEYIKYKENPQGTIRLYIFPRITKFYSVDEITEE